MPFSDTQRHGFPCLYYWVSLCFVVLNKLKCTVNKFLPQKNGRVLPFYNAFVIRVLRLQHATCPFPKLKGTVSRAFTIWFHYVLLFCSKLKCTVNKFLLQKKRQSPAVLQWVAIRVLRLQHATCPFPKLKGTVFRAFTIGFHYVLSF